MLELIVGAFLGLALGLTVIEGGTLGALAAILVAVGLLQKPHLRALAGALMSFGALWLLLSVREVVECAPTPDFCGNTNLLPFDLTALAILVAGIGCGIHAFRRRESTRD